MASFVMFAKTIILGAAVLSLSFAAVGQPAHASQLQCGDVVTRSVTLREDLICPEEFARPALTIGADNVRIDLGGHTIVAPFGVAIRSEGHNNVTIHNGSMDGWHNIGAEIHGAVRVTIRDMAVLRPIIVHDSRRVVVENNTIIGDDRLPDAVSFERTHRSRVRGNHISISSDRGVRVVDSRRNRIVGNNITASGGGVWVEGRRNAVVNNVVNADRQPGITVTAGRRNVVRGNQVTGSLSDGIRVERDATSTIVDGNVASRNEDTGLRILSPSTRLRNNTANRNGEWGIWAVPGVRDEGGNRAEGNGFQQCHNVACNQEGSATSGRGNPPRRSVERVGG